MALKPRFIPAAMVKLGVILRELRAERGISVRATARACRLTPSHLAKIEKGRTFKTIGLATLITLAKFYEIPVAALLRQAGFVEEVDDPLPEFATYLRQKYQLPVAAIRDLNLAKEIVEKKYSSPFSK